VAVKNNIASYITPISGTGGTKSNNVEGAASALGFVDVANHNYHLQATSPAVNAGIAVGYTQDLEGNPIVGAPDAGAYEYGDGSVPTPYVLTISAEHGLVTRSPDREAYSSGEGVTVQAIPESGYRFVSWSGDLTGSSNPAMLTMDGNKTITADFATNAYTLAIVAGGGSVSRSPDRTSFTYGETVSLQAVPNTGYHFTGWSGDLSGSGNPSSLVMNGNKSVTAGFAINTYSLNAVSLNGSVAKSPEQANYVHGTTVSLQAIAADGYEFSGWSGAVTGATNPASVIMDGNKSVTASFTQLAPDHDPPVLYSSSPRADAIQVPLNSLVVTQITDSGEGVDANTVSIQVDGDTVYSGNVASFSGGCGVCRRIGTPAHYVYAYQPADDFDFDSVVAVTVSAADLAGNAMAQQSYSFRTQMRAFGSNRCASWGPEGLDKGGPATARDSSGNVWVVWHAGTAGARDIYLSRLAPGDEQFGGAVQLTTDAADQCNPDIAVGADGRLYVVWQDNRRGNWDIFASTSTDGIAWSAVAVTDFDDNEVDPVIAIDARSPGNACVAWQDDRTGNQDIYVASSSTGFVSKTVVCVTSDAQDQIGPRMAVDAADAIYLVWTDFRNGSADVYGAASNAGPWTNVPITTGAGDQYAPVIAAEPTGSVLHFAWVGDAGGDDDIFYASSLGLPASPVMGESIIDDTSGEDQRMPAIVVGTGAGGVTRIFVSWQDFRNAADGRDSDLYAVEVKEDGGTNLFVGDGATRTNQSEPCIEADLYGHPYVVWTDDRNANNDVYFAASTFVEPTALDVRTVVGAAGSTVGVASPARLDEVSVAIPAGACPYDVTVSIAKIRNLDPGLSAAVLPYEFGPSGLQFDLPVTITIPYAVADRPGGLPQPYWYDAMTGTMSQQGITNVERVALSATIHALQFQTTHFTPYAVVAGAEDEIVSSGDEGGGGGSGGGGCALSPKGANDPYGYFVPYVILAVVMGVLRLRGSARRSAPDTVPGRDQT
jgi:hypothetical protein